MAPLHLTAPRLLLRTPVSEDAGALSDFQLRNRAHLQAWEPLRDPATLTVEGLQERLRQQAVAMDQGKALHLLVCLRDDAQPAIGECNFTNIIRGPFQACHLGFALDAAWQGQGLMREALTVALAHVFGQLRLHRVMANHLPHNQRSARLLAALGFRQEGLARGYLKINGVWADHVLTSLLNPDDEATAHQDPGQ